MIEAAEEAEVFAAGQPRVEAAVTAGVIAELAAYGAWVENGVVAGNSRMALSGQEQSGENAEERGFTGTVRAKQGQCFARANFERDSGEGDDARLFERLEQRAPAAAGGRERLFEVCNADRRFAHDETYSVSPG